MSNYTKATNFANKDTLPPGDAGKIVKGTEIDAEFVAIAAAIASKPDSNSPILTGTPQSPTASPGTNTTQIATTAFVTAADTAAILAERSATVTLTNKTLTTPEISSISNSGTVTIPTGTRTLVAQDTTDILTNKTIDLATNTVVGTKNQFNATVASTDFSFIDDYTGSNQSLTTNGYQKFPGGLIIQWGEADDTDLFVAFPIPFPNACLNVVMNLKDVTYGSAFSPIYLSTKDWTNSGFTKNTSAAGIGGKRPWIAFGR